MSININLAVTIVTAFNVLKLNPLFNSLNEMRGNQTRSQAELFP